MKQTLEITNYFNVPVKLATPTHMVAPNVHMNHHIKGINSIPFTRFGASMDKKLLVEHDYWYYFFFFYLLDDLKVFKGMNSLIA